MYPCFTLMNQDNHWICVKTTQVISFLKDFPTSYGIKVIKESVLVDCVVEKEHNFLWMLKKKGDKYTEEFEGFLRSMLEYLLACLYFLCLNEAPDVILCVLSFPPSVLGGSEASEHRQRASPHWRGLRQKTQPPRPGNVALSVRLPSWVCESVFRMPVVRISVS